MSLPVATTISGDDGQRDGRFARPAADGRYEPYKVSLRYDNPMTRLPHGFPIDQTQREVKEMLEKGDAPWLAP
jgi:hypothetical protein